MYDFTMTTALKYRILENYPIFKESNYSFFRKEKDGYISVRSANVPRLQELFLNRTTQKILDACNGEKNTEQIVGYIQSLYPDVTVANIEKDVINNLSILSRYQLIEWKGRNPFMKALNEKVGENKTFELLDEGNIRELMRFIHTHEQDVQFMNFMGKLEVYQDEIFLRDLLFNFSEDFFAIREAGCMKALISIKYHANINSTVCSIGVIVGLSEYVPELLAGIVKHSQGTCNRSMSKVKLQLLEQECTAKEKLISELKKCGFIQESSNLKEYQGQNICNFSFYYENKGEKAC